MAFFGAWKSWKSAFFHKIKIWSFRDLQNPRFSGSPILLPIRIFCIHLYARRLKKINLFRCVGFCGGLRRFLRGFHLYGLTYTPDAAVFDSEILTLETRSHGEILSSIVVKLHQIAWNFLKQRKLKCLLFFSTVSYL